MNQILCLASGSVAGGFARWLLTDLLHRTAGRGFPYGTMVVNLSGCLLIGLIHGLGETRLALNPHGRLLLMTGFCGAFTTFSTWMLESSDLLDRGRLSGALVYILGSVLLGFALFRAGAFISKTVLSSAAPAQAVALGPERVP